jgi:hypothetical protein
MKERLSIPSTCSSSACTIFFYKNIIYSVSLFIIVVFLVCPNTAQTQNLYLTNTVLLSTKL